MRVFSYKHVIYVLTEEQYCTASLLREHFDKFTLGDAFNEMELEKLL